MRDFAAYWARFDPTFSLLGLQDQTEFSAHTSGGDADQFAVLARKACHERKFFFTEQTSMGLCPRNTKPGDRVVVLYGGSVPYILRPTGQDSWTFVGECYVDGMMFGETRDLKENLDTQDQVFHIR
ncbi:het domain-containing protein [Paraphaeosphaeria sporulosa]